MATSAAWKFDFGSIQNEHNGYIKVPADLAYSEERGYGFLGLGPEGYKEDCRSDGFVMKQGQEIKLQEVARADPQSVDDDAVAVTDPGMPIRFAVYVTRIIPAGTCLTYEFHVHVQNVYSKVTGTYEDTMLNIAVSGHHAAIASAEIEQLERGRTLWVLGDSTVNDQLAPLPYFRLQNYSGVGQALSKYVGADVAVSNHAESGLETYTSKPHFDQFKNRIQPGDIVFFEFGHNHKTDGPDGFYNGISYYYDFIHAKGAHFIIVGPIDRHRAFQYDASRNQWTSTLDAFSAAGKRYVEEKVAAGATDIAFVDLNAPSLAWYTELCAELGRTAANTDYYFRGMQGVEVDGTHPNDAGVDHFAKMFMDAAKATVEADPEAPQAKVLAGVLAGARDETPYTVPDSITSLGPAPNSAYPEPYVTPSAYPLMINHVALDANKHVISLSVTKQGDLNSYGRGIVQVYKPNGELKGTAYADAQIDNTIEGTQVVSFTTDLAMDTQDTLKAYVMEFEDKPGYPLTDKQLAVFFVLP